MLFAGRANLLTWYFFLRDESEFVEWGYGGMGSVKSVASSGVDNKWSRVAGNSAFGSAPGANGEKGWGNRGRAGRPADDDDDGSGMAWVKRRREQREKEKL